MSEPSRVTSLATVPGVAENSPLYVTLEHATEGAKKAASQARKLEREAQAKARDAALEAQTAAHAAELRRLDLDKLDAQRTAHAHGFHKGLWMGAGGGALLGAALVVLIVLIVLAAGTESTVRGAAAGSMIRAQENLESDVERFRRGEQGRDTPRLAPPEEGP